MLLSAKAMLLHAEAALLQLEAQPKNKVIIIKDNYDNKVQSYFGILANLPK